MREDLPYDAVPNFTAADAVRVVGVGRNEYIAIMVQAKSKKLLWRMNKGIVKDLLPSEPKVMEPEPWWTVNLVNLSEFFTLILFLNSGFITLRLCITIGSFKVLC